MSIDHRLNELVSAYSRSLARRAPDPAIRLEWVELKANRDSMMTDEERAAAAKSAADALDEIRAIVAAETAA